MNTSSASATVIGGGIAGLAAAIGLNRIGYAVTVLERAPILDDAGAGISVQANGLHALDALGVGDAVRAAGERQGSGGIRTPRGRWLSHMDAEAAEQALGSPVYSFRRADLHHALRSALPLGTVLTGVEVRSMVGDTPSKAGPTQIAYLHEGTETTSTADVIVAADGVHSRIRAQLWPAAPDAVYGGSTVWRGITEFPVETPADIDQTWGPGAEFGSTRLRDGRVEWHAEINAAAGIRYPDPLAEVRARFGGWHDPIPALLDATRPENVLHHDVFELATPLPSFVRGRVVVIGDAAHAMTPHLGQGASQALEDAAVLAASLASGPDIDAALRRFDTDRRPRTQAIVTAARQTGRIGQQLQNPIAVALRNAALRVTPPRVALKAMVKHASWTPPHIPLTPATAQAAPALG